MVAQALATIALGLLGASGVAKVVDPEPTSGALRAARLPSSTLVSRSLGVIEIAVAVLALAIGGSILFVGALLYFGFTVFTYAAVRGRFPLQSCGCFGSEDTPATWLHVTYNLVSALAITWVAASGLTPITWTNSVLDILLYAIFGVVGIFASYLLLTRLPQALELSRSP